jgi:serine/threonine protein phosphatase PrpC
MEQEKSNPIIDKTVIRKDYDGCTVHFACMKGYRNEMEDTYDISPNFFGIYDGHGGKEVANYLAENLGNRVKQNTSGSTSEYVLLTTINDTFYEIDKELQQYSEQGSTAICAFMKNNQVYIMNTGDSRAVIKTQEELYDDDVNGYGLGFRYTIDHKPNEPNERKRIEKSGSFVGFGSPGSTVFRVDANLAVSRAFGDFSSKNKDLPMDEQSIIPGPEVYMFSDRKKHLMAVWNYIVLACDGVWDVMSNDLMVEFIGNRIDNKLCSDILDRCLKNGSTDNMSIMIIFKK